MPEIIGVKFRTVGKVYYFAPNDIACLLYTSIKSSDDKKQWVKDEEAAQVVYEIGLYIMDGLGPSQIARKLTERKILTPAAYYASKGRTTNVTKKGSPYAWDSSTIADIMDRWREYLGHTVNFKTRKKSYKSKKTLLNPESEWKIFENTHEAIWTEAIADAARLARQTRRRPTKMGEMGMFSGMMFCADCGSIMYQCRATNFRRDQEYYLCSGYRKSRDVCGQTHSIRTVILEELVLQNLREIVSFASQRKDDFVKMVMDADMRQRNRGLAKRQKTLADAEKRITELDTIFKRLYEDTISGKLSDERFQKLSADYEKEQHQLQEVAAVLRGEIEAEEQKSANVERFLSVVEPVSYTHLVPFPLEAAEQVLQVRAAGQEPVNGGTQLRLVAGAVLFRLMLDVALALVPAGDDDRQAVFFADPVTGAADEVIAPLIGVIVLVVLKADRIENQVVMNVVFVYVGGEDKFIFAAQDLPRQLHTDPVGLLWRDLPRFKRLDEVPAQVRALVDGMAAGPGKFDVGGLCGAAEGGHQQFPICLIGIADIVNGRFQR